MLNYRSGVFYDFEVWLQLHNLPLICMNENSVKEIRAKVGKVVEVDVWDNMCYGKYAKVRVSRPLLKPFERCVVTRMNTGGHKNIIVIRYECLSDFRFACGRVGHILRDCDDITIDKKDPQFGL